MKFLGKLIYMIVGALLIWALANDLTGAAAKGGSLMVGIARFMLPHDIANKEAIVFVEFLIWLIIFWFAQKPILGVLGWIAPNASKYAETKQARMFQAVSFEFAMVLLCGSVVSIVLMFIPPAREAPFKHTVESYSFATEVETETGEINYYVDRDLFPETALLEEAEIEGYVESTFMGNLSAGKVFEKLYFSKPSPEVIGVWLAILYKEVGLLEGEGGDNEILKRGIAEAPYSRDFILKRLRSQNPVKVDDAGRMRKSIVSGPYRDTDAKQLYYQLPDGQRIRVDHIVASSGFYPQGAFSYFQSSGTLVGEESIEYKPSGSLTKKKFYKFPDGQQLTELLIQGSGSSFQKPAEAGSSGISNLGIAVLGANRVLEHLRTPFNAYINRYTASLPGRLNLTTSDPEEISAYFLTEAEELVQSHKNRQLAKSYFVLWKKTFAHHWKWALLLGVLIGLQLSMHFKPYIYRLYYPVLRFLDKGRMGFGGSARFAGLIEEWRFLKSSQPNGILLGRSQFNPFLTLSMASEKHMMTIASTRSGKGSCCIVPNLLEWKGNCVMIDPKGGENAAITARRRREMGQEVYIINPFGELPDELGETDSFNPLARLDLESETIIRELDAVVDALVIPPSDPKADLHWVEGAKTILRGYIVHLLSTEKEPSLTSLRGLFALDEDGFHELVADMSINDAAFGTAKETAARILQGSDTDEIRNIISNANSQTEWLRDPAYGKAMKADANFDFEMLKSDKVTVYLVIPDTDAKLSARFIRLFLNQAMRTLRSGKRAKDPVLMIIDEFADLGRVETFISGFAKAAGANVTLWPILQDIAQLKRHYPSETSSFISGCRAVQVFGVDDPDTLEFVEKRLGTRPIDSSNFETTTNIGNLREQGSIKDEIAPDVSSQYILKSGSPTLLIDRRPYYQDGLHQKILKACGAKIEKSYDPNPLFDGD